MSRVLLVVLCLGLTFLLPSLAFAQTTAGSSGKVYTWVDKSGRRHYSDQPAAPSSAKPIDVRVSQSRTAPQQGDVGKNDAEKASTGAAEDMTRDWEQGASSDEKIAPTRDAACTVAQKNHRVLSDQSRSAYKRDADGKPVELSGDDRKAALDRAQADVDAYCKK